MSNLIENVVSILPVLITIIMVAFLWYRRKTEIEFRELSSSIRYLDENVPEENDYIEKLVTREDVELRLLKEIVEIGHRRPFYFSRGKSKAELKLEIIQSKLRKVLRNSIDLENFKEIEVRVISLLDQVEGELNDIRQRIPFEGLDDPERSLLIDLIEEIDPSKEIPHHKAKQLADIIKIKHQSIEKLQLENAKSAGWTRWGTVGTVSFGLLSLALSLYTIYA